VSVKNLTLDQQAQDVLVDPYGTFSAIVPLQEGRNALEILARSTSGFERRELVSVVYRQDETAAPLPVRAQGGREKLLEERLRQAYLDQPALGARESTAAKGFASRP
jgi:hypothetical protein